MNRKTRSLISTKAQIDRFRNQAAKMFIVNGEVVLFVTHDTNLL